MSAEQRVVSFVVLVSWLIWGGVMAYSWTNANARAHVYSEQMVPSFLDFLSEFPLETVQDMPFESLSRITRKPMVPEMHRVSLSVIRSSSTGRTT